MNSFMNYSEDAIPVPSISVTRMKFIVDVLVTVIVTELERAEQLGVNHLNQVRY